MMCKLVSFFLHLELSEDKTFIKPLPPEIGTSIMQSTSFLMHLSVY